MGGFPKDLIQQCLSSVWNVAQNDKIGNSENCVADDGDDPGSSLQLVLSVLVELEGEANPSDWKALLDLLNQQQQQQQQQQQPTAGAAATRDRLPTLISRILHTTPQDTNNIAAFITQQQEQIPSSHLSPQEDSVASTFYLGFQLISLLLHHPRITPFEVHSAAVESLVLGLDYTTRGKLMCSQSPIFLCLCLLLCTWSLEQCQREIQEQTKRIRWKRVKSLLVETIQLYQRHVLVDLENGRDDDDSDDLTMHDTTDKHDNTTDPATFVCLWTEFLMPQCQSLWRLLPDTVVSPSSVFFQAVAVSISSHLAVLYESASHSNDDVEQWLLVEELYQSLKSLDLPMEQVWCHPWRVATFLRQNESNRISTSRSEVLHESFDWWTLDRGQKGEAFENDSDGDENSLPPDDYENINTSWNELGVTLLAWKSWKDSTRPQVYRIDYESQLWFPHINVLMNPDQHPSTDITLPLTAIGIHWLQMLLPMLPTHRLSLPTSFSLADPDVVTSVASGLHQCSPDPLSSNEMPPNHPVWTLQLLFNAIMSSAKSSNSALLSSMELFTLCKALLSKYKPSCQLDVVFHHLLPACPHPGLKPKIMDLLRPLLVLFSQEKNPDADRLWQSLEDIVRELGKYVDCDSKVEGNGGLRLEHTEELIDLVEYFISACTMIQLGWNIIVNSGRGSSGKYDHPSSFTLVNTTLRSTNDDSFALAPVTLKDFHKALQTQLELWDDNLASGHEAPPPQFFRLNLLENLLQQLTEL